MPTVITSQPGSVNVILDEAVQVFVPAVSMSSENALGFKNERAIITSIGIQEGANFQFMQTLGSDIYIYVFGDKIGQVVLSGLAFATGCPANGSAEHGVGKIRRWYTERKLSSNTEPITFFIGNNKTPLVGFVTGWSASVADAATNLISWKVTLAVIPERAEPAAGGGPTETPGGNDFSNEVAQARSAAANAAAAATAAITGVSTF